MSQRQLTDFALSRSDRAVLEDSLYGHSRRGLRTTMLRARRLVA
jgi:hypothetical protein